MSEYVGDVIIDGDGKKFEVVAVEEKEDGGIIIVSHEILN